MLSHGANRELDVRLNHLGLLKAMEMEGKTPAMARSTNIDGGWAWLVLMASFVIHLLGCGLSWSTGVYNLVFLEEFKQSKSITAWVGSLPTAVMYLVAPFAGVLVNKYGCRPVMIAGGLLTSIGLCLSFFAHDLIFLLLSFGILTGLGNGLSYIPAVTSISFYFKKKVTLATGIAVSGIGVGSILFPAAIRWLIDAYNWNGSLLILGALSLNICVCGALVRPPQRDDLVQNKAVLDLSPFKKLSYWMLCINNFLFYCANSVFYLHLPAQAVHVGIDFHRSAMLLSGLGVSNLLGRLAYGCVGQHPKVNVTLFFSASYALTGLAICLVPLFHSFEALMCLTLAFGLFSASFGTLLLTITLEIIGVRRISNGYSFLLIFMAAGQLVGGPLAGAIFDYTSSYELAFYIGGAVCILSGGVMLYPYWRLRTRALQMEYIVKDPCELEILEKA